MMYGQRVSNKKKIRYKDKMNHKSIINDKHERTNCTIDRSKKSEQLDNKRTREKLAVTLINKNESKSNHTTHV